MAEFSFFQWTISLHLQCCLLDVTKALSKTVLCYVGGSVFLLRNQQPKPVTSMLIYIYAIVLDCDVLVLFVLFYDQVFLRKQPLSPNRWVYPTQVLQVWLDNDVFCIKSIPCCFLPFLSSAIFFPCLCTQAPQEHLCGPPRPAASRSRVT